MNENKFTPRAEEALRLSQEAAGELGHGYVGTEHLLLGLIREDEGMAHEVLTEAWGHPSVNIGVGGSIPFISDFQRLFPEAQVVVTGVEDPMTNAHSEQESQSISDLRCAILAEALLLTRLPRL